MVVESEPVVRILAEIEEEHRALTALVAMLSVDQLTERRGGHWSAVDLINHITAWQVHALTVARAQAASDAPEVDPTVGPGRVLGVDAERHNRDLLISHRDWNLDQALAWHNRVFAELKAALAVLPPARLLGGPGPHGARQWYGRPALVHAREHRAEFQQRIRL